MIATLKRHIDLQYVYLWWSPQRHLETLNQQIDLPGAKNKLAGLTSDVKIRGVEIVLYHKCRDEKRCTAAVQHGAKKLIHKTALQWWEVAFLCPWPPGLHKLNAAWHNITEIVRPASLHNVC